MAQQGSGVVGLLLAAGSGARFGGAKLLAPLPNASYGVAAGTPIGVAACLHLVAALPRVLGVVRPRDVALRAALEDTGAQVILCERAHEGMGVTLASATAAMPDADGWVVALADMPWISPATVAAIATRVRDGASIVAPQHRGQRGHPVGFGREHYAALIGLTGDEGARGLLAERRASLELLDVDDPGVLLDVDRGADLDAAPR